MNIKTATVKNQLMYFFWYLTHGVQIYAKNMHAQSYTVVQTHARSHTVVQTHASAHARTNIKQSTRTIECFVRREFIIE